MRKGWDAPVYAFYSEDVDAIEIGGRRIHVFACTICQKKVNRYLDSGDARSTSNLRKHVAKCRGDEALASADAMVTAMAARPCVEKMVRNGTLTGAFSQSPGNKFATRPLTKTEGEAFTAQWICESLRPFDIVEDPGYRRLVKTGRPDFPTPSSKTLRQNVYNIYDRVLPRVSRMLKVSVCSSR